MKLVSYSLFNSNCQRFERQAYIRGFYLNCRMNNLLYPAPDWITHVEVERAIYEQYKALFDWLVEFNSLNITVNDNNPALCEGMLWRMRPVFTIDVTHVLCRDSDAISTYREREVVQRWVEAQGAVLSLHDSPGHDGLMGGMVGFDTAQFKAFTGLNSWDEMVAGFDLSERGSDQHLLNQRISPKFPHWQEWHIAGTHDQPEIPGIDKKLWETNLTCRHTGSAGVVDLEVIRQLKRFDAYDWKHQDIERQFADLFYWQL